MDKTRSLCPEPSDVGDYVSVMGISSFRAVTKEKCLQLGNHTDVVDKSVYLGVG